jgi:hypothetical protein
MKKNDGLKKHHFWILFGLVPLFVMIAVLMVTSSVGAEIDKKMAEIKSAEDSLKGKQPKSGKILDVLAERIEEVKKKKQSLWAKNWDIQKSMYTWPKNEQLQAVEKMDLRFGAPIPADNFTRDQFKLPEVYLHEYSDEDRAARKPATRGMVMAVAPTEFRGGWERVLRHVTRNGWGPGAPSSEQIWLLMEDLWVQRALLDAVRSVNAQFSEFKRVEFKPDGKTVVDDPRRRRFESRIWAVELEVQQKDGKPALAGRLINLTNRLQLMGMDNTMTLRVWLTKGKGVRPFEFRIGGEFLPGVGALKPDGKTPANVIEIPPLDDNLIPASIAPNENAIEIDRVEQVLDKRTVPVRRIEGMALGLTDARHNNSQLVPPRSQLDPPIFPGWVVKEGDPSAIPTTGVGVPMGDMGGSSLGPPGGMGTPPSGSIPGAGESVTANRLWGGGTLETVVDANKNRYIEATASVRRLPVAVAVIVDQSQMQDVLLAFANSPTLRFQITQVTWNRFRGNLGGTGPGGGTGSAGDSDIEYSGPGNFGSLGTPPGMGSSIGPPPGMGGSSLGPPGPGGSSLGPPAPGGSSLGPPPGMGGVLTNPYTPGGMGGMGGLTTVSESQLTSGLVELTVYGVVSLYEKYDPLADAEQQAKDQEAKDKEAKDKEAKDKEAKENEAKEKTPDADPKKGTDPMPKEPVTPEVKGTKMRRRVRKS